MRGLDADHERAVEPAIGKELVTPFQFRVGHDVARTPVHRLQTPARDAEPAGEQLDAVGLDRGRRPAFDACSRAIGQVEPLLVRRRIEVAVDVHQLHVVVSVEEREEAARDGQDDRPAGSHRLQRAKARRHHQEVAEAAHRARDQRRLDRRRHRRRSAAGVRTAGHTAARMRCRWRTSRTGARPAASRRAGRRPGTSRYVSQSSLSATDSSRLASRRGMPRCARCMRSTTARRSSPLVWNTRRRSTSSRLKSGARRVWSDTVPSASSSAGTALRSAIRSRRRYVSSSVVCAASRFPRSICARADAELNPGPDLGKCVHAQRQRETAGVVRIGETRGPEQFIRPVEQRAEQLPRKGVPAAALGDEQLHDRFEELALPAHARRRRRPAARAHGRGRPAPPGAGPPDRRAARARPASSSRRGRGRARRDRETRDGGDAPRSGAPRATVQVPNRPDGRNRRWALVRSRSLRDDC